MKIKFMRGAIAYAAKQLNISFNAAWARAGRGNPDIIALATEFEMKKKKQIKRAINKYVKARSFNPIPADIEDQLNGLPEEL